MAGPESEDSQADNSPPRDRIELISMTVAVLWVSAVAVVDAVYGGKFGLMGFLAIGPFIAAAFAGPRRTALVGLFATFFSIVLSTPPRQYDQLNHFLRVFTLLASSGVAIWISYLRSQRNKQLWSALSETRIERRRRVAAETAQSMQALARALTTSADPAQVADAVFGALRDELSVDAAAFATTNERGVLCVHRRFGYREGESESALVAAMEPDGELWQVLAQRVGFFADSVDQRRQGQPRIRALVESSRFSSFAVVPLVVSDHAVGAVVVQWVTPRSITEADKRFLFTITGAAAQAVERARLTLTEFINLERTQHLQHLSSALAVATTPGEVAREAIAGGRRALGAQSAACRVPIAGGRSLSCLASSGQPALLSRGLVPVDNSPSGSTFTSGRTITTTVGVAMHADAELSPELVPSVMVELGQPVTIVTEALMGSVGSLGVLSLAFVGRPEPSEPELRFLSTLAGLTAQALERAQLFEQERQALRDAEEGRERLSLLSDVTKLLSSSLDPTIVIQRTMNLVVGRLSDACVVQVPGDSGLQRLSVRAGEVFESPAEKHLIGQDSIPFDSDAPAAIAYRTGRIQLAPTSFPDDGDGAATALAIPFAANGQVIGVMTFFDGPERTFEPDDVSLATEVASRTGVALSNATRFQREHVVAEVLQRAVLPDFLPTVGGLEFDAEYRAGAAGTYVGGDWYDVFQLDEDKVIFSVGDVMGKGAPAAALMGQVRSAIRAYAVAGQSPSEVLSSLDRLFDVLVEDRVVTVVVGSINPKSGTVHIANAGHPSPLIVRAAGTTAFASLESSLLIAAGLGGPERPAYDLTLSMGDALVMYSDGLIERRSELITVGMQRLADAATAVAAGGWPGKVASELATRLGDEDTTDDVVVLALRYVGVGRGSKGIDPSLVGTERDGMSTLRLDPIVESTPRARHWITELLRDVPVEVSECAALLTSELVTNAVLHAATPFTVTLHLMADRIRVDVADGNPVAPSVKDYATDAATGRGLTLFNTLASDWGVQPVIGGKIVWFELPVDYAVVPTAVSDGTFRFDLVGLAQAELHDAAESQPLVQVELLGVPVALLQKASEEYEALFRELRLMKERSEADPSLLPERLTVLLTEIGTRFSGLGPGIDEGWQEVVDAKKVAHDWRLALPEAAETACVLYDAMLDEADEFGHVAQLLTLPASAASVAVRRWFLSELVSQLRGNAPIPWPQSPLHRELMERASST